MLWTIRKGFETQERQVEMRNLKSLTVALCAGVAMLAFATATPAKAQEPHYLQALGDLRTARDYISFDKGGFNGERHHAVDEINKAIDEIKRAAWDDGKQTRFSPPGHATNGWAPMHYAQNALIAARDHVSQGVEPPQAQGLRGRASQHIADAERTLEHIMQQGAP
jgi:hypothetical protein